MGNCSSPLRRHMRHNNTAGVLRVVQAAGEGSPDIINEDFTADCILDSCQQNQSTVLHSALSTRQLDILEILLQYGGDPNARARHFGQTILHQACRQNNLAAATMVVKYGGDIHGTDDDGRLPIHCAASSLTGVYQKNVGTLEYILEDVGRPDDIHVRDGFGDTPLHKAVKVEHFKAVEYLLSKGADLNANNNANKSPLDLAKSDFRRKIDKLQRKSRQDTS